ncbi:Bestrophin, RFP-TM, chloride channel-domain-containing protein [Mycena maculata]|uniref:Bestrophin, RFP-TM, chloride channel-domain-containing protein n=1 Tax=Mycena maculata TaxID=230809 RepID=A0AAD7N411_9AGAR|nr:Bestrophin, RFP-TM, chloride channel-domain-containing protein [Mycena maculata]
MSTNKVHNKRSFTGNHNLLPAMRPSPAPFVPKVPTYTFLRWTFGRGSVIWKIWPAVLLHTLFAALVVYVWKVKGFPLIPNVMLTVMGVVIGFVISYRAMSGYDRYWMGRTAWADVIRNARTMGRLIWYHVPPKLTPGPLAGRSPQELGKVMAEKRMALDLIEAFAAALKHHLRGEVGIYFVDLYDLVRPLHDFTDPENPRPTVASAVAPPPAPSPAAPRPPPAASSSSSTATGSSTATDTTKATTHAARRPAAPADATPQPAPALTSHASTTSIHAELAPASNPLPEADVLRRVSPEVIPFAGVFTGVARWVRSFWKDTKAELEAVKKRDRSSRVHMHMRHWGGPIHPHGVAELEEFEKGENLPEEILRCLSEWVSVLEDRNTVPGASLGSILGAIAQFEISLTTLEHILTTPLPFVYSVHIRSVVWMYLFLLPFQLLGDFGWHTVPGVMVAAFIYLGFIAAGEEIEQPFGYDDNDLDLDMFCRDIIRQDLQCLKKAPCRNAWFPPSAPAANGSGPAKEKGTDGGLLAPRATMHGGNMYRASLASLSDTASVSEGEDDAEREVEEAEAEEEEEEEEEEEGNGDGTGPADRTGVRVGKLVDVTVR